MTEAAKTDSLIKTLAGQAGDRHNPEPIPFGWSFFAASSLSLVVEIVAVFIWLGFRPDLLAKPAPLLFKLASTMALAAGGFFFACRVARPGSKWPLAALVPGVLLLLFRGVTDDAGLSLMGNSDVSALACVWAILVVSAPGLLMTLAVMRTGAPTRPAVAGAAAGLVAGALGAAAYAFACKNDAGLFLMIWYPAAILFMTGLGALIGRRALAW